MKHIFYLVFCGLFTYSTVLAQSTNETPKGWHLLSHEIDNYYGIDLNKAYNFLKAKHIQPVTTIVAVLDSGVDTLHEDLKNILWKNPKEIPNNGIDDDKNGYIDDVYGWNFLGGKDGRNIKKASDEKSRFYHQFKSKFDNKNIDSNKLSTEEKFLYRSWLKSKEEISANTADQSNIAYLEVAVKALKKNDSIIRIDMGKNEYTFEELEKYSPKTEVASRAKMALLNLIKAFGIESEVKNTEIIEELENYIEGKKDSFENADKPPFNYREEFIKDNYNDINDKYYGNNNVMAETPMHGTHVTGIIGAERGNNIGVEGVADNVKIMTVRVVPDGDEYDKDIALGIIYAVDNGAKVINMSFGKGYSPEKRWVDSAVEYAAAKDVLIIHAAGNERTNIDEKEGFPNPYLLMSNKRAANFITVGASSDPKVSGTLAADFSNYGKNTVDVFAPGVKIYSTLPGGNNYGNLNGTSMATPIVSGLAALIRSYYPTLTAVEVKNILEQSATVVDATVTTYIPGTKTNTSLKELSRIGGIVNAYNAVVLADKIANEKAGNKTKEKKPVKKQKKN